MSVLEALATEMPMQTTDGTDLSEKQRRKILGELIAYQTEHEHSDADMARALGLGSGSGGRSMWNRIKSGRYNAAGTAKVLARGAAMLAVIAERMAELRVDYVDTSPGRQALAVCHLALRRTTIGLIVMPSGSGKTMALRHFAGHLGHRALYIHAGEALACKAELAAAIARKLGLSPKVCDRFPALYWMIREHLAGLYAGGRGAAPVILIDEATCLRAASLAFLRNLHDDVETRVPIVLADTWTLHDELRRVGRMAGGYEQLRSRAGAQYRFPNARQAAMSTDDVRAVAQSVVAGLGHTGRLSAASVRYLTKLAAGEGTLRNVAQRLTTVADVAEANGRTPSFCVAELDDDDVCAMLGATPVNPGVADAFEPAERRSA